MKRIIYHIGTHKTATTTIQNALSANREMLQARGILYPATDRPPFEGHNKHNSLRVAVKGSQAMFEAERDTLWAEFEASGCHTMILSEEGLSATPLEHLDRFRQLAEGCEVQTVCYLRRQDLFVEALWNQNVKFLGETAPIARFCRRRAIRARLQYDRILLDGWSGFSDVAAVGFDAAKKEGVFATFIRLCGLPDMAEPGADNVSPSVNCALVFNEMNRGDMKRRRIRIMQAFAGDRSRHVLGRALRREILDSVADCNRRLEAEYGIRFSDEMPEEQDKPLNRPDPVELSRALAWLSMNPVPEEERGPRRSGRKPEPSG